MMDELVMVTCVSLPNEAQRDFQARLAKFWTHMLRTQPTDYEHVYAEATQFEQESDTLTRQYLVNINGLKKLCIELGAAQITYEPIDEDDTYNKYEATSPDWFQLEH